MALPWSRRNPPLSDRRLEERKPFAASTSRERERESAEMWVEILCSLVIFKVFRRFFFGDDDDLSDVDSRDSDISFAVAARLEKIHGGKAYVGLRIPDPETGSRQHIDVVLVTKREVMVVAVRSFSGFVEVGDPKDRSWVCTRDAKHRPENHPDPVLEVRRQVAILEAYLDQRGVQFPEGYLVGRVVLPNPNCRAAYPVSSQPEVISFEKWTELKPGSTTGISNWIKDAFQGGKGEKLDGLHQKLQFILSTSPTWDRLELKNERNILGEFIKFKGNTDDMQVLGGLKRSRVSRFVVQKSTLFGGLGRSRVHILYSPRDYRSEGGSSLEWKEVAVKHATEVLFQPLNSNKARKFKVSSISSLSLSA